MGESDIDRMYDAAADEARETLPNYILDDMPDEDAREHLSQIATIWIGSDKTDDKYAQISDIFGMLVDLQTQRKIGHVS